MSTIFCSTCKQDLPYADFPPSIVAKAVAGKKRKDLCRKCRSVYSLARTKRPDVAALLKARSKEKYARNGGKAKQRAWRAKNPEKAMLYSATYGRKHRDRANALRIQRREAMKRGDLQPCEHQRAEALRSNHGLCAYCNVRPATELDHLVPLTANGMERLDNLVPSCKWCNVSKSNRPLLLWLATSPDCLRRSA
jgi:5-methylcytosine-specific restriction endonuclease McrA